MLNVSKFNPTTDDTVEPITLTPNAISHIQKTIKERGMGLGLRLTIKKTGCSGYAYIVDILDEPTSDDHIFSTKDGLLIAITKSFLPLVKGTSIDYVQSGMNGGFRFDNPNQKGVCGCGESFTV